jgi:RsiW-degrading membrane proteinase PrsW (M82 family)
MLSEWVRFEMTDVEILERVIAGEELGKVVLVMSFRLPILLLPMIFLLSACVLEESCFHPLTWGWIRVVILRGMLLPVGAVLNLQGHWRAV